MVTLDKKINKYKIYKFNRVHKNHEVSQENYRANIHFKKLTVEEFEKYGAERVDGVLTPDELIEKILSETGKLFDVRGLNNMDRKLHKTDIPRKVFSKQLLNNVIPWLEYRSTVYSISNKEVDNNGLVDFIFWTKMHNCLGIDEAMCLIEVQEPFRDDVYKFYIVLGRDSVSGQWKLMACAVANHLNEKLATVLGEFISRYAVSPSATVCVNFETPQSLSDAAHVKSFINWSEDVPGFTNLRPYVAALLEPLKKYESTNCFKFRVIDLVKPLMKEVKVDDITRNPRRLTTKHKPKQQSVSQNDPVQITQSSSVNANEFKTSPPCMSCYKIFKQAPTKKRHCQHHPDTDTIPLYSFSENGEFQVPEDTAEPEVEKCQEIQSVDDLKQKREFGEKSKKGQFTKSSSVTVDEFKIAPATKAQFTRTYGGKLTRSRHPDTSASQDDSETLEEESTGADKELYAFSENGEFQVPVDTSEPEVERIQESADHLKLKREFGEKSKQKDTSIFSAGGNGPKTYKKNPFNTKSIIRVICDDLKVQVGKTIDPKMFNVGEEFENVEDILSPWVAYCAQTLTAWRVYYCHTEDYYCEVTGEDKVGVVRFELQCVQFGKPRQRTSSKTQPKPGPRNGSECPFGIKVHYHTPIGKYVVTKFIGEHKNHELQEGAAKANFYGRLLTAEESEKYGMAIVDNSMSQKDLLEKILAETGKELKRHDLISLARKLPFTEIPRKVYSKQILTEVIPWLNYRSIFSVSHRLSGQDGLVDYVFWSKNNCYNGNNGSMAFLEIEEPFQEQLYKFYIFLGCNSYHNAQWMVMACAIANQSIQDLPAVMEKFVTGSAGVSLDQNTALFTNISNSNALLDSVKKHFVATYDYPSSVNNLTPFVGMLTQGLKKYANKVTYEFRLLDIVKEFMKYTDFPKTM